MNEQDFSFEITPWEATVSRLSRGDRLSAVRFLALLEHEDQQTVEDAALELESRGIELAVEDLPDVAAAGDTALRLREERELVETGALPGGLPENDPLRLYLEEIARLAERPAHPLDMDAQTAANLPKVVAMAKDFVGRGVLLLDLIQEGSLGLWQSMVNGEPDKLDWWIRQAMERAITLQARAAGAGDALRDALERYKRADRALLTRLGHNATPEEIARELDTTPAVVEELQRQMEAVRAVEQAKKSMEPREQTPEDEQAVEDTAYFQMRSRIAELLSVLEPLDAQVLTLRFGLEGGLPMDPEQTGKRLGLTPGEVTARETAALEKLRGEA